MTVTDHDIAYLCSDPPVSSSFRRYLITQSAMTRRWTIVMTSGIKNINTTAYRFQHAADAEGYMEKEFPRWQLMAVQQA